MIKVQIDFTNIGSEEDFYDSIKEQMNLPIAEYTPKVLCEAIAQLQMPLKIEFIEMTVEHLELFEDFIQALEDTDDEIDDFDFRYYLEQFDV